MVENKINQSLIKLNVQKFVKYSIKINRNNTIKNNYDSYMETYESGWIWNAFFSNCLASTDSNSENTSP